MKGISISILLILFFMGQALQAQSLSITEPVRFLSLGDSYTIGESVTETNRWPVLFSKALSERGIQVDSLMIIAKTGWRTDQLINSITDLNPLNFNLVSVLIGVNNQYQGKPIGDMKLDFERLLTHAVSRAGGNKKCVFVVSIPDYAFTPYGQSKSPDKISKELNEYNAWQKRRTLDKGIAYVDITAISRTGLDNTALVAEDGLHPSGKQYALWVQKIMTELIN